MAVDTIYSRQHLLYIYIIFLSARAIDPQSLTAAETIQRPPQFLSLPGHRPSTLMLAAGQSIQSPARFSHHPHKINYGHRPSCSPQAKSSKARLDFLSLPFSLSLFLFFSFPSHAHHSNRLTGVRIDLAPLPSLSLSRLPFNIDKKKRNFLHFWTWFYFSLLSLALHFTLLYFTSLRYSLRARPLIITITRTRMQ